MSSLKTSMWEEGCVKMKAEMLWWAINMTRKYWRQGLAQGRSSVTVFRKNQSHSHADQGLLTFRTESQSADEATPWRFSILGNKCRQQSLLHYFCPFVSAAQISTATGIKVKFKFSERKKNVLWKWWRASVPASWGSHHTMRTQTIQSDTVGSHPPPTQMRVGSAGQPSQNSEAWISQHKWGQAERKMGAEVTDCGAEWFA